MTRAGLPGTRGQRDASSLPGAATVPRRGVCGSYSARTQPGVLGEPGRGMCDRRNRTLPSKERPSAQAPETWKRNNYRQDKSTPARPARPSLREAAATLAGGGDHSLDTPPLEHTQGPGAGRGRGGAVRRPANPERPHAARQRERPMGKRRPSSSRYRPVHVLHSTQWPQRKARSSHGSHGKELGGEWPWTCLRTKMGKGKGREEERQ